MGVPKEREDVAEDSALEERTGDREPPRQVHEAGDERDPEQ